MNFFEVHREIGPGFLEKVHENALLVQLKRRGIEVESQVPVKVSYKGSTVGDIGALFSLLTLSEFWLYYRV